MRLDSRGKFVKGNVILLLVVNMAHCQYRLHQTPIPCSLVHILLITWKKEKRMKINRYAFLCLSNLFDRHFLNSSVLHSGHICLRIITIRICRRKWWYLPFPSFLEETCELHVGYNLESLEICGVVYGHWYHGRGSRSCWENNGSVINICVRTVNVSVYSLWMNKQTGKTLLRVRNTKNNDESHQKYKVSPVNAD